MKLATPCAAVLLTLGVPSTLSAQAAASDDPRMAEIRALHQELDQLQSRLAALERPVAANAPASGTAAATTVAGSVPASAGPAVPAVSGGSASQTQSSVEEQPRGNYTNDQIAYTRGYLFNYLPFYHMGLRANCAITPRLNAQYSLVNGANDTGDLNGFKSEAFLVAIKPASTLNWNVNYYFGVEGRDVAPTSNPVRAPPPSPTEPGLPTTNISPVPNGNEHIFDTYATWRPNARWTLVAEADYVVNRTVAHTRPSRVAIGAFEGKYALSHSWNIGGRAKYFNDRGGLFSGKTQALKGSYCCARSHLCPRLPRQSRVPPRLVESAVFPERHAQRTQARAVHRNARIGVLVGHEAGHLVGAPHTTDSAAHVSDGALCYDYLQTTNPARARP